MDVNEYNIELFLAKLPLTRHFRVNLMKCTKKLSKWLISLKEAGWKRMNTINSVRCNFVVYQVFCNPSSEDVQCCH